jgi:hypothetical protein
MMICARKHTVLFFRKDLAAHFKYWLLLLIFPTKDTKTRVFLIKRTTIHMTTKFLKNLGLFARPSQLRKSPRERIRHTQNYLQLSCSCLQWPLALTLTALIK